MAVTQMAKSADVVEEPDAHFTCVRPAVPATTPLFILLIWAGAK